MRVPEERWRAKERENEREREIGRWNIFVESLYGCNLPAFPPGDEMKHRPTLAEL